MKNHDPDAAAPVTRRSDKALARDPLTSGPPDSRKPPVKRPAQGPLPPPAGKIAARWCAAWATGALLLASWPFLAAAQDYGAMLRQQQQLMSENIARGERLVEQNVQTRMRDPQVQAAYRQYLARADGGPVMDYRTYTTNYIYTNGFSAQGIAHARANEAGIQAREQAAVQGLRNAQAARGAAQQAQRDGYFRNQQEAGLGLMGQSTYLAPNGTALALPHTWPKGSTRQYQGQTYHVDPSGRYHVLGSNGAWYPLTLR